MIPEIIVYYLFNIYTCIATVVGAATTIIVIRIYYPRNGFKIASTNKKEITDRSTRTAKPRSNFDYQLFSSRKNKKCRRRSVVSNDHLWKADIITNKPLISGNTTALTVIKEQPGSSSLLAGCFLPGLLVIMFVIVVVLKWRSTQTRQQHMIAKARKLNSINRQIAVFQEMISICDEIIHSGRKMAEYQRKISNCNEFIQYARQKQLTCSSGPVLPVTNNEDKLYQLNNNAVTGKEIVVWTPKEKQQLSKLLEGKTFVLTLDVKKFNMDVKRCKLQPSMLDWTVEKPCCLEIVPWQAKPKYVIPSHESTSPSQEKTKIDAITKHQVKESRLCVDDPQENVIKGNELVLHKHMAKDHLMKLLEGKTIVLTLDVQLVNLDIRKFQLQPSMMGAVKPYCQQIVPWQPNTEPTQPYIKNKCKERTSHPEKTENKDDEKEICRPSRPLPSEDDDHANSSPRFECLKKDALLISYKDITMTPVVNDQKNASWSLPPDSNDEFQVNESKRGLRNENKVSSDIPAKEDPHHNENNKSDEAPSEIMESVHSQTTRTKTTDTSCTIEVDLHKEEVCDVLIDQQLMSQDSQAPSEETGSDLKTSSNIDLGDKEVQSLTKEDDVDMVSTADVLDSQAPREETRSDLKPSSNIDLGDKEVHSLTKEDDVDMVSTAKVLGYYVFTDDKLMSQDSQAPSKETRSDLIPSSNIDLGDKEVQSLTKEDPVDMVSTADVLDCDALTPPSSSHDNNMVDIFTTGKQQLSKNCKKHKKRKRKTPSKVPLKKDLRHNEKNKSDEAPLPSEVRDSIDSLPTEEEKFGTSDNIELDPQVKKGCHVFIEEKASSTSQDSQTPSEETLSQLLSSRPIDLGEVKPSRPLTKKAADNKVTTATVVACDVLVSTSSHDTDLCTSSEKVQRPLATSKDFSPSPIGDNLLKSKYLKKDNQRKRKSHNEKNTSHVLIAEKASLKSQDSQASAEETRKCDVKSKIYEDKNKLKGHNKRSPKPWIIPGSSVQEKPCTISNTNEQHSSAQNRAYIGTKKTQRSDSLTKKISQLSRQGISSANQQLKDIACAEERSKNARDPVLPPLNEQHFPRLSTLDKRTIHVKNGQQNTYNQPLECNAGVEGRTHSKLKKQISTDLDSKKTQPTPRHNAHTEERFLAANQQKLPPLAEEHFPELSPLNINTASSTRSKGTKNIRDKSQQRTFSNLQTLDTTMQPIPPPLNEEHFPVLGPLELKKKGRTYLDDEKRQRSNHSTLVVKTSRMEHNTSKLSSNTLPVISGKACVLEELQAPSMNEENFPMLSSSRPVKKKRQQSMESTTKPRLETSSHRTKIKEQTSSLPPKKDSCVVRAYRPPTVGNHIVKDHFPKWGGSAMLPSGSVSLINTCPADGWIVIMHVLWQENIAVRKRLSQKDCKVFLEMENLYKKGQFNAIKMIVMKLNSLQPQFNRINFWNNEYVLFIRHFNVLYGSKQLSRCSSPDCPKRDRMIVSNACPTWMDPNISLQETVLSWMQEKETTKCYERDIGAQYCSGQRQLHQRTFDGGSSHPVLIPVDTELMAEMDEILTMNKVPPHLEILGRTYTLRSITLISKEEQHYVCIFRYKGQWLFYDGRENDGWPRPLGANTSVPRQTYFISHLLYE